jgi:hypothetical protein
VVRCGLHGARCRSQGVRFRMKDLGLGELGSGFRVGCEEFGM